jgi:hypothetical protein
MSYLGLVGGFGVLSRCRPGCDTSENYRRRALHDFQAFGQQLGISVPKPDVVGSRYHAGAQKILGASLVRLL